MRFDIYTISNDLEQYDEMKRSFQNAGFLEPDCRFVLLDNSKSNEFDPFRIIHEAAGDAPGRYAIVCHQDIRLDRGDGYDRLCEIVEEMDRLDPKWAALGNAGSTDAYEYVLRITDASGYYCRGDLPARVHSLDENFLLFKTGMGLKCSPELSGFHFYGTDLCLNARILGLNSYVVNFHLSHLSAGKRDEVFQIRRREFQKRWSQHVGFLYVQTSCAGVFLSRNRIIRTLFDRPRISTWLMSRPRLLLPIQRRFGQLRAQQAV